MQYTWHKVCLAFIWSQEDLICTHVHFNQKIFIITKKCNVIWVEYVSLHFQVLPHGCFCYIIKEYLFFKNLWKSLEEFSHSSNFLPMTALHAISQIKDLARQIPSSLFINHKIKWKDCVIKIIQKKARLWKLLSLDFLQFTSTLHCFWKWYINAYI